MFHAFNSFCDSDDEISYEIKEEKNSFMIVIMNLWIILYLNVYTIYKRAWRMTRQRMVSGILKMTAKLFMIFKNFSCNWCSNLYNEVNCYCDVFILNKIS